MRFITSTIPKNYTCFKLIGIEILIFKVMLHIFLLIRGKSMHWSRNVLRLKFVELCPNDSVKGFKKTPNQ
jgi:hypothetical protein